MWMWQLWGRQLMRLMGTDRDPEALGHLPAPPEAAWLPSQALAFPQQPPDGRQHLTHSLQGARGPEAEALNHCKPLPPPGQSRGVPGLISRRGASVAWAHAPTGLVRELTWGEGPVYLGGGPCWLRPPSRRSGSPAPPKPQALTGLLDLSFPQHFQAPPPHTRGWGLRPQREHLGDDGAAAEWAPRALAERTALPGAREAEQHQHSSGIRCPCGDRGSAAGVPRLDSVRPCSLGLGPGLPGGVAPSHAKVGTPGSICGPHLPVVA